MKIIISRKGFDSSAGGRPSPILKDGRIFSIPIPSSVGDSPHRYRDVAMHGLNASDMLNYVGVKTFSGDVHCHFDPMLHQSIGLFGQAGNAQRELENLGIEVGDLFLFFGWFRDFRLEKPRDYHHIFGWLQIGHIIRGTEQIRNFCHKLMLAHPHACKDDRLFKNNTLYVSKGHTENLMVKTRKRGHGVFSKTNQKLIFTQVGKTRSNWLLPQKYFSPTQNPNLFENRLKWSEQYSNKLVCAGYGQEFVIDASKNPSAIEWVSDLLENCQIARLE